LTDLDWEQRKTFLFDLSLIGEAVQAACRDNGLRRINYEVLGKLAERPPRSCACPVRVGAEGAHWRPGVAISEGGTQ